MSTEEPKPHSESTGAFSHKRALHNLLGMPAEPRTDISYARTPSAVEFLNPRPRHVDDDLAGYDEASIDRELRTEPHDWTESRVQPVTATGTAFEFQPESTAPPGNVRRQDEFAEDVIVVPAARIVPTPPTEAQRTPSAIAAHANEHAPVAKQPRDVPGGGPAIQRTRVDMPARVQSVVLGQASAPQTRAPNPEAALPRDRDADSRRHIDDSAGGDAAAVENLRRTVKELAARMGQSLGRTQEPTSRTQSGATPAIAPPAALQPTTTHPERSRWRQSGRPGRSGPARAFWQRNYLARRSF